MSLGRKRTELTGVGVLSGRDEYSSLEPLTRGTFDAMPFCRRGATLLLVALAACTIYGPKDAVEDMARAENG